MPYELRWSEDAAAELQALPAFHRSTIVAALAVLRHQATVETRNRKPLSKAVPDLPHPAWEVRIGDYRAFYAIEDSRVVRIFRVIFKGKRTTADALKRGRTL